MHVVEVANAYIARVSLNKDQPRTASIVPGCQVCSRMGLENPALLRKQQIAHETHHISLASKFIQAEIPSTQRSFNPWRLLRWIPDTCGAIFQQ